jgi:vacuolar-type H+-ATPase subunit E/Vma4
MDPDQSVGALISDITRQVESEIETIRADAHEQSGGKASEADREIERMRAEALRHMEGRLATDSNRLLGQAGLEQRGARLTEMRAALRKAFEDARKRIIARCDGPEYARLLERRLDEALRGVEGPVRVGVRRDDMALCRDVLARLGRQGEPYESGDAPGTVIVGSADGLRTVDNSLDTRLVRAEETMEGAVLRRLFPSEHRG